MTLINSRWDLLRYKLRHLGVGGALHVAYLDLVDGLHCRLAKRFPGLALEPRSIQIECTTRCNLKCTMCELSYWSEKGGNLDAQMLRRMVGHLPRLKRVDLTGIGEALMNTEVFQGLEFLKSRGIYVTMNDNFTMITEKNARRIIDLGVDQVFLSLDGATAETFEAIRVGAKFDKVIANARRLIQMRRQLGKRKPEVKIITVVTTSNYREMPGIIEIAHELGVGMVSFVNVIVFENTTGLDTAQVGNPLESAIRETLARAKALGILVKIELFDKLPVGRCDFPWTRNFVTYDGYVHPCCYTTQTGDRTAQNRRSFGNLLERSFRDIWKDHAYQTFRRKMAEGILPYQCGQCPKFRGRPDAESPASTSQTQVALEVSAVARAAGLGARRGAGQPIMSASLASPAPRVGVVILNYNGKVLAERCLRSALQPSRVEKDLILVDNASTDGSVDYLRQTFPGVLILESGQNLGVTGGRNVGFREAVRRGSAYVLSLDNDTLVGPSCIDILTEAAQSDPRIAVVGPKTYMDEEGSRVLQCVGGAIEYTENVTREMGAGEIDVGQYDQRRDVGYFPGCAFMARASIMEELAYLDESFHGYGHEDTDFCFRAARKGYRIVYVPEAVMRHGGSTTMGAYSPRRKYLEAVNSAYFVRKYASPRQKCKYAFYAGFGLLYALAVQGPRGNARAVLAKARGIWHGLRKPID